jgi:tRNA G46 methylase TrmB
MGEVSANRGNQQLQQRQPAPSGGSKANTTGGSTKNNKKTLAAPPPLPPVPQGACELGKCLRDWIDYGLPCLDIRDQDEFTFQSLSPSRNIPLADVKSNIFELPPVYEPVLVLCRDATQRAEAGNFFGSRKWVNMTFLQADDEDLWSAADVLQCAQRNVDAETLPVEIIFRPSKTVVDWAQFIEDKLNEHKKIDESNPYCMLDVACGSGRDVVYMAKRGWNVVGLDEFDKALGRMAKLAISHRVADKVVSCQTEVRADGSVRGDETFDVEGGYQLVTGVRFLQKEFLPKIEALVAPGGFVLYETFAEESAELDESQTEKKTPKHGRLLSQEHLSLYFPDGKFTVYHNELRKLKDGRLLRAFVAQKNWM